MSSLRVYRRAMCQTHYGKLRKYYGAPIMIAIRDMAQSWYVEAKDGSFSTTVSELADCAWCAKANACEEWASKHRPELIK